MLHWHKTQINPIFFLDFCPLWYITASVTLTANHQKASPQYSIVKKKLSQHAYENRLQTNIQAKLIKPF